MPVPPDRHDETDKVAISEFPPACRNLETRIEYWRLFACGGKEHKSSLLS
jgi:hypothetical protein